MDCRNICECEITEHSDSDYIVKTFEKAHWDVSRRFENSETTRGGDSDIDRSCRVKHHAVAAGAGVGVVLPDAACLPADFFKLARTVCLLER